MPRSPLALLFLATLLVARGAGIPHGALVGHTEGDIYFSANGAFSVPIPVRAEMGGMVTDNANVVTFKDDFNILYIIAAFPLDSSQRWEISIHPRQEYLQNFFAQFMLPDFRRAFAGAQVETTATYMKNMFGGALVIYTLLPGGSMFAAKVTSIDPDRKPPVAKRGNLIFVNNDFVYVISSELAERVTEGSAYTMTQEQEDLALREKLVDMAQKIKFRAPSAAP